MPRRSASRSTASKRRVNLSLARSSAARGSMESLRARFTTANSRSPSSSSNLSRSRSGTRGAAAGRQARRARQRARCDAAPGRARALLPRGTGAAWRVSGRGPRGSARAGRARGRRRGRGRCRTWSLEFNPFFALHLRTTPDTFRAPVNASPSGRDARAWVEVDLASVVENARTIARVAGTRLLPAVEADADGGGAVSGSRALGAPEALGDGVPALP